MFFFYFPRRAAWRIDSAPAVSRTPSVGRHSTGHWQRREKSCPNSGGGELSKIHKFACHSGHYYIRGVPL